MAILILLYILKKKTQITIVNCLLNGERFHLRYTGQ